MFTAFKIGDRVRNTGKSYSELAKEGVVVSRKRRCAQVKFDDYLVFNCAKYDIELIEKGV